jgi:putative transposase
MTETIGAAKGERTKTRLAYRSGYYSRALITRVGTLELRVPQDPRRALFDRTVPALTALREGAGGYAGRDVRARSVDPQSQGGDRGVATPSRPRQSAPSTSHWTRRCGRLPSGAWTSRSLYLILDARYERVREGGVIRSLPHRCGFRSGGCRDSPTTPFSVGARVYHRYVRIQQFPTITCD